MSNPTAPWRPLGCALLDFHRGDAHAELVVASELWEDEVTPVAAFYRPDNLPLPGLEQQALELAHGRVLDLGAGAGRHALELERRGLEVVAVDLLDDAVQVMRERGVGDPRCGGLEAVAGERFDTVLMLMHGIGIVGNLAGLGRLLEALPAVLTPEGRLICDSADLAAVLRAEAPALLDELSAHDRFIGEVQFALEYRKRRGPVYPWLFVDPRTLALLAGAAGFEARIVARGERAAFLAELTRSRAFTGP
ncbi:MAG TPA: methyltransferase domain-containing protein [Methylomirabilota bacterium]|nr:methyltransferase domain-containing protein [Methylomirabilota bacterium]